MAKSGERSTEGAGNDHGGLVDENRIQTIQTKVDRRIRGSGLEERKGVKVVIGVGAAGPSRPVQG